MRSYLQGTLTAPGFTATWAIKGASRAPGRVKIQLGHESPPGLAFLSPGVPELLLMGGSLSSHVPGPRLKVT